MPTPRKGLRSETLATTTTTQGSEVQGHGAHADHGHAGHGRELQHHFETPQQQKDAATLGMWVFLVTELMLFGGIFMAYAVYRWAFPDIWAEAAHHLNTPLGAVNTVVLLVSSLTVALAVNAAEEGRNKRLIRLLGVTMVLGVAFLGIKAYEYSEKFAHCAGYKTPIAWASGGTPLGETECLVPGRAFVFPEAHGTTATGDHHEVTPGQGSPYKLFYLLYFIATGLHAVHMLIGLSIVGMLTFMAARGVFTTAYSTPVEIGGLYWHLIDIIWVFLFPLFYLVH
ncbi:MAG: cytochrome c oxidase subunit 3 family protein [Chloroflexia bacterium]|nr:cytochrome c oxidase subunit 3 family protein [Chloroflexia bacterium]